MERWHAAGMGAVAPQREPFPRAYGTLIIVGYLVAFPGFVLAVASRIPVLGGVCLVLFAATWVTRNVLIRWRDANTSVSKLDAVAAPLGFVAAIALMMITSSPWRFMVGGLIYVVPKYFMNYAEWNQRRRSASRD